ncbi:biotin--[acetyl-CoA-carboxylase] ligase [Candidatus Bathyarchaeota archaeon]|nr:biotin--[acetyl-CoA-carboxylase] ligase [Candidatus Bathyarchaeota archaeon]
MIGSLMEEVGLERWRISRVGLISSTQDVARVLPLPENSGRVVIAEAQSRGRGRRGRVWHSSPGGLYMTLIIPGVERVELVPIMAGVSTAEAVRDVYGLEANLEWPNDIMFEGKKLGGILTEALWMRDRPERILIGIGINVNNTLPETLTSATSISSEFGGDLPLRGFTLHLVDVVGENLELLKSEPGELLRRWRGHSTTLNRRIEVYDG